MFSSLLFLNCLFVTVESSPGQILPPRNVSLRRINDFDHELSWEPPEHSENCKYTLFIKSGTVEDHERTHKSPYKLVRKMEGGFLHVSIRTLCNNSESEPVVLSETNLELVTDFQCYVHSLKQTNCSWSPASDAPDLRFFYQLVGQNNNSPPSEIQECSSYYTDGVKTGCSLQADDSNSIYILFNATVNSETVRNTFYKHLLYNVRPPPLKWMVKKSGDKFIISWEPPEVITLEQWAFTINYTECNIPKSISTKGETSLELPLAPHCQYSMAIKADSGGKGETPWSDTKYFDAGPSALVYAAIIIPLVIASLTVLAVVCYQKKKDNIFPKVPAPRDLLSDICDNNNKSTMCNLYAPAVEEENCKITLVIDPQISKPDC